MTTPFNRPFIVGQELSYIVDAVQKGQLAGNGFLHQSLSSMDSKAIQHRKSIAYSFGDSRLRDGGIVERG